ncbi:MAG: hypothetical protein P9L99_08810 [Candidatus Lernaella stagnicola]|nr:hypothetical protein [Candidatus Lernaella stagnicola]
MLQPTTGRLDLHAAAGDALVVFFARGWVLWAASLIVVLLGVPSMGILFGPLFGGLFLMAAAALDGKRPRVRDVFGGFRHFVRFFAVAAIWSIALILGTMAYEIGAVLSNALTLLLFPAIVDECGPALAWKRNWRAFVAHPVVFLFVWLLECGLIVLINLTARSTWIFPVLLFAIVLPPLALFKIGLYRLLYPSNGAPA